MSQGRAARQLAGGLRAFREFRTKTSTCWLDVDLEAWQKHQQKSLVSSAQE